MSQGQPLSPGGDSRAHGVYPAEQTPIKGRRSGSSFLKLADASPAKPPFLPTEKTLPALCVTAPAIPRREVEEQRGARTKLLDTRRALRHWPDLLLQARNVPLGSMAAARAGSSSSSSSSSCAQLCQMCPAVPSAQRRCGAAAAGLAPLLPPAIPRGCSSAGAATASCPCLLIYRSPSALPSAPAERRSAPGSSLLQIRISAAGPASSCPRSFPALLLFLGLTRCRALNPSLVVRKSRKGS